MYSILKKTKCYRPYIRIYSENNINKFITQCQQSNFTETCLNNDTNVAYELLSTKLNTLHEKQFPLVKLSQRKLKDKPWVTTSLKKSIAYKNNLFRKYIANPTLGRKLRLKECKQMLNKTIKRGQTEYYQKLLSDKKNSSKKAWKIINNLMNSKTKKPKSIDSIKVNGIVIQDKLFRVCVFC